MANIYSLKSGLASDTTVWSGGAVPVQGDRVLICAGHTVTLDGVYEWGDDTNNTISINGVSTTRSVWVNGALVFSRSVNSQLTLNGGMSVKGSFDMGTESSPIPDGVTATLLLNKSSVLAANKYLAEVLPLAEGRFFGAAKKRWCLIASAISAGATSIQVTDATGWKAGDRIVLPNTHITNHDQEEMMTIHASYVSGNIIPLTAATTYAHKANFPVANVTNNVTVTSYNSAYRGSIQFTSDVVAASLENGIELGNVTFLNMYEGYNQYGVRFTNVANYGGNPTAQKIKKAFGLVFLHDRGGDFAMWYESSQTKTAPLFEQCVFASPNLSGATAISLRSTGYANFLDCLVFGRFGFSGRDSVFTNGWILGDRKDGAGIFSSSGGDRNTMVGTKLNGPVQIATLYSSTTNEGFSGMTLRGVDVNSFGNAGSSAVLVCQSYGTTAILTLDNCLMNMANLTSMIGGQKNMTGASVLAIKSPNNDQTIQHEYRRDGTIKRDNTNKKRSSSSFSMKPTTAGTDFTYTTQIASQSGVAQRIVGYINFDTSYYNGGTGFVAPTITVDDGTNTLATFTASGSANTWIPIDFTFTQSLGYAETLNVTFKINSQNIAGMVYFDGIPISPFVTQCRHYGFDLTQETSPTRTVDPYVSASEAVASAYTGITLDGTTKRISFGAGTGDTAQKFYDYTRAWACLNLTYDIPLARAGALFGLASGWTVIDPTYSGLTWGGGKVEWSAAGSKSGSFDSNQHVFAAAGAYDMGNCVFSGTVEFVNSSGGNVVVIVPEGTDYINTGPNITVNIAVILAEASIKGIVAGSRMQVKNLTSGTIMVDADIAGTSWSESYLDGIGYSAGDTIRVRVTYCDATSAMMEFEAKTIATASGWSVLVEQSPRAAYDQWGEDGTNIPEFVGDITGHVYIDANDLDGQTLKKRLGAWYCWVLTTGIGIEHFFKAIEIPSQGVIRINVDVADILICNTNPSVPLRFTDIDRRLYRSDGSSIIAPESYTIHNDYSGEPGHVETGVSGLTGAESSQLMRLPSSLDNSSAVLAALNATTIPVNMVQIKGHGINGSGSEADPWGP